MAHGPIPDKPELAETVRRFVREQGLDPGLGLSLEGTSEAMIRSLDPPAETMRKHRERCYSVLNGVRCELPPGHTGSHMGSSYGDGRQAGVSLSWPNSQSPAHTQ